jgi:hypothetical protein
VPTWLWVTVMTGALILVVALMWAVTKGLEPSETEKRREADHLLIEAGRALAGAGQSEESAQRAAERVTAERAEAARLKREAEARQARAEQLEEIAESESQRARESERPPRGPPAKRGPSIRTLRIVMTGLT